MYESALRVTAPTVVVYGCGGVLANFFTFFELHPPCNDSAMFPFRESGYNPFVSHVVPECIYGARLRPSASAGDRSSKGLCTPDGRGRQHYRSVCSSKA